MQGIQCNRRRVAAIAAGTALLGSVLLPGVAAAQTPPAPATTDVDVQFVAAPGPGPGCFAMPLSPEQAAALRSQMAARLAQALGKPQADVERALAQFESRLPRPDVQAAPVPLPAPNADPLAGAATRLGVTPQELMAALEAAPARLCAQTGPAGAAPAGPPPKEALFEVVAQQLGRGITAAQVQAALQPSGMGPFTIAIQHPVMGPPGGAVQIDRQAVIRQAPPGEIDEHLRPLAELLGVTLEQLKAAMQAIGGLFFVKAG